MSVGSYMMSFINQCKSGEAKPSRKTAFTLFANILAMKDIPMQDRMVIVRNVLKEWDAEKYEDIFDEFVQELKEKMETNTNKIQ